MAESRVTSIKYKTLDDLVKFVCITPAPILNHVERNGRHFYFFHMPFSNSVTLYFAEESKKIDGSYISVNRMSGKITAVARPSFDAQALDIPLLEVQATDLTGYMESS